MGIQVPAGSGDEEIARVLGTLKELLMDGASMEHELVDVLLQDYTGWPCVNKYSIAHTQMTQTLSFVKHISEMQRLLQSNGWTRDGLQIADNMTLFKLYCLHVSMAYTLHVP